MAAFLFSYIGGFRDVRYCLHSVRFSYSNGSTTSQSLFLIGPFHTPEDKICIIIWLLAKRNLCDSVHLHTDYQCVNWRNISVPSLWVTS